MQNSKTFKHQILLSRTFQGLAKWKKFSRTFKEHGHPENGLGDEGTDGASPDNFSLNLNLNLFGNSNNK